MNGDIFRCRCFIISMMLYPLLGISMGVASLLPNLITMTIFGILAGAVLLTMLFAFYSIFIWPPEQD